MHVEEHLMMSCCKTGNDAPVFCYFNLGGISLIVKSVNTFIFVVPAVQIFALRLWAVFLNWEFNMRKEELK